MHSPDSCRYTGAGQRPEAARQSPELSKKSGSPLRNAGTANGHDSSPESSPPRSRSPSPQRHVQVRASFPYRAFPGAQLNHKQHNTSVHRCIVGRLRLLENENKCENFNLLGAWKEYIILCHSSRV